MSKRYLVRLTEGEWADPGRRAATGRGSARELTQPGILKPDDRPTGARLDPRAYRRGAERGPLDRVVELRFVDGRSYTTVRRMLQKNALKPWLTERWCIPPPASGAFVWRMEDYTRPYDPKRPQVCLDEVSKQLLAEQRPTRPPAPGRAKRVDYE